MFNINTFNAHKQGIRENMEQNLIWDKYHGTMKHKSSIATTLKFVKLRFDAPPEETIDKMEFITKLLREGTEVGKQGMTEQPYCTTYTVGVTYNYNAETIRDEITDTQVTIAMQNFIKNKLTREIGRKQYDLDCRVMELFKTGKIDWETVVESHQHDCEL